MSDKGHELTDKKLKELENKLKEHYKQASDEVKKKLDDYLKAFKAKDAKHLANLQKNFTKENYEEYIRWRQGQVLISERWEEMRQSLAEDYHNANMIAKSIIKGYMPDIYALNHNYGTYDVEHKGLVDTSYTLYDRQTVERLMRDDPDMLPPPGRKVSKRIAEGKDILWNKGQIQSAMWQSVTQGESMEKIAHRLARTVGDKDMAAAIRNARTMTTGAECAGRVDSYKRAESMGIDLQQEWMSTLDNRTRHSHRAMHGERIPVDGTFSNGCRFPGDPHGPAEEVYNCRCTLVSAIKGFEGDKVTYSPKMGDMSFEEWVGEHEGKESYSLKSSSDITFAKIDNSKAIKEDFAEEYRKEYDNFTQMFGELTELKDITVAPYKDNNCFGEYYPNSREIVLYGVGGKDGRTFTAQVAQANKASGEWSTGSVYHSLRHELGHALQHEKQIYDKYWSEKYTEIDQIRKKLLDGLTNADGSVRIKELKGKLSKYGFVKTDEFISECVAEYVQNPKKARSPAKKVVEILLRKEDYYADVNSR